MSKTTELMAVNDILTSLGEIPVDTLAVATNSDAAIAYDTLIQVKTEVEQMGWWFNSIKNVSYAPTGGQIPVPANVLSLKQSSGSYASPGESKYLVEKDGYVYDIVANTNNFASSVKLDVIVSTDFENLPEVARRYITIRAARIAQEKILGDGLQGTYRENHEEQAWSTLEAEDAINTPGGGLFMQKARARARRYRPDPVTSQNRQNNRGQ